MHDQRTSNQRRIGTLVSFAHWACLYAALAYGAGKDRSVLSQESYYNASRFVFISRIILLVFEGLSRTFFLHFLRQIFHVRRSHGKAVWSFTKQEGYFKTYAAAGLLHLAFVIVAPLVVSVGCRPEQTLSGQDGGYCSNNSARWIAVTALTGFSELLPLLLALQSVRTLETNLRRKFDICIILGSCRLIPLVIFTLYTTSYLNFTTTGTPSLSSPPFLIYQQILVATSALSLCIPVLRNFGSNFNNGGLGGILDGTAIPVSKPSPDSPDTSRRRSGLGHAFGLNRLRSALSSRNRTNGSGSDGRSPGVGSGATGSGPRSFGSGLRSFADEPDKSADIGKLGQPGETEVWVSTDGKVRRPGRVYRNGGGREEDGSDGMEMGQVGSRPGSKDEGEAGSVTSGSSQRVILKRKEYEVVRT
ncbi:hypothetical protein BDZ85DRAFT_119549 [Elsinoe ampelina]|uniref:Rhodopsin domain-containing protein n=1 Tax=Elsinoe ampelina TaxID=302913 RepID=A0A6A6GB81_9PEZI|nr:hypothetical protein BDZ85DRAFT_119549 [Elsinoe ampelina]